MSSEEPRERPRLNLKPRDEAAAAKAAQERAKTAKSNPFGEAKPREAILATRTGKKEEDILKAELEKEKLKLRLTAEQQEQRQAAESAIEDLEEAIKFEEEDSKTAELASELDTKKADLDSLLASFEKMAVDRAKSGEGMRPSERRRLAEEREREQGGYPVPAGFPAATPPPRGNYGNGDYSYAPAQGGYSGKAGGGRSNGGSGSFGGSRGGYSGNYDYGNASGPPPRGGGGGGSFENFTDNFGGVSSGGGYTPAYGSPGSGGFRSANGGPRSGGSRSGYNEPLAAGYDRGGRGGRGGGRPPAGGHDIFADGASFGGPPDAVEGGYARGQDRF